MKSCIGNELKDNVSEGIDFDLGYFDGKHGTKRWLIEDEDIKNMYLKYTSGEIYLWLEALEEAEAAPPQKKSNEGASRRDDKEARVEKTYDELLEKHKENFSTHQLNLWARMIVNKIHFSYDDPPPKNPLITGSNVPKPTPKDTQLTEAILGAATAFTKAVAPAAPISLPNATDQIYSQERKADIRLKNFEQLKCLQQLFKDNVLTEEDFKQQKQIILNKLSEL